MPSRASSTTPAAPNTTPPNAASAPWPRRRTLAAKVSTSGALGGVLIFIPCSGPVVAGRTD